MALYEHATYILVIREPTITVVVFSVLSLAAYQLSKRLPAEYERLAIVFARTSVFLVNFGFWVGSLWGDSFSEPTDWTLGTGTVIPDLAFVIAWAIALIVTGVWAVRADKHGWSI